MAGRPGGAGGDGVLPLRPLTLGELLDAGVALLRRHARVLLLCGAVLAVLEQLALYPLRHVALLRPAYLWTVNFDRLGAFWLLIALGFGTETCAVTLLGGVAARAARATVLGEPAGRRRAAAADRAVPGGVHGAAGPAARSDAAAHRLRPRLAALGILAVVLGTLAAACAAAGLVPWFACYGLTGLAAPALIIDRQIPLRPSPPGARITAVPLPETGAPTRPIGPLRALARSVSLVGQGHMRPAGIRLLGYLAWFTIRLALGLGGLGILNLVVDTRSQDWWVPVSMALWAAVNAVAYPALACLDAVLHLENRMRVEGLDIALSRALHQGAPLAPVLAVPR